MNALAAFSLCFFFETGICSIHTERAYLNILTKKTFLFNFVSRKGKNKEKNFSLSTQKCRTTFIKAKEKREYKVYIIIMYACCIFFVVAFNI